MTSNTTEKSFVYDLRTRLFHAVFAVLFLIVLFIVKVYDDSSEAYPFHMIFGLILGFATLCRLMWGFSTFVFSPRELWRYLRHIFDKDGKRYLHHNPASSWGSLGMFTAALGLAVTGVIKSQERFNEFAETYYLEEIHEWLTEFFWVLVALHVAGIALHSFIHRDGIALRMVTGGKSRDDKKSAAVFAALLLGFTFYILMNYDFKTRQMKIFGQELQLSDPVREEDVQ